MKETLYELLKDNEKKQLGKNEEAKMTIYNALPQKEYERVFMCKTAKEFGKHSSSLTKAIYKSRIGRDEKKRLDHLKQDQEMLVIKIFSERKKAGKSNGNWRRSRQSQIYKGPARPIKGPPGLEEEALVEFMVELYEEDEDGRKNEKYGLFNLKANDQSRKA
ncbi:hypothetical protein Tco_1053501 [Tanacetum coccineum]|uniref:Uncharacterized protein n=1 Tax=Tanacetum coccineum TaxID=301880 RepID=A0ABQ5GV06_9ASTR